MWAMTGRVRISRRCAPQSIWRIGRQKRSRNNSSSDLLFEAPADETAILAIGRPEFEAASQQPVVGRNGTEDVGIKKVDKSMGTLPDRTPNQVVPGVTFPRFGGHWIKRLGALPVRG
jgi:hypothetical protein